jgi:gamma-glutamyltranspeptidase/glutathione hydrolase
MNVLQSGGNAVDAAVAAAAVNVVTKPNRTQLGGDAFVLIWHRDTGAVECLNAGGRAPGGARAELFTAGMPRSGAAASTVPGIVDSWLELLGRRGSRTLSGLLEPAIALCDQGFPVSLHLSTGMAAIGPSSPPALRSAFLKDGQRPYEPAELFRQPELADSLRAISNEGRDGFYAGRVGKAIVAAMDDGGGLIGLDDLSRPTAHWHDPLVSTYRGCTVFEQALPSQGLILLEALKAVEAFDLPAWGMTSPDAVHVMVEATRRAFADVRRYVADPDFEHVPADWLLSDDHAREIASAIDMRRASGSAVAITSDTTSFVVADENVAVCFIQSVFANWGSRFVIPATGILMNNRMMGFNPDPQSPNRVAPHKRAVHTLNNFLVVRDGRLLIGGGTPGADFQVQTNLQVIAAVLDWGHDLQAAVDSPRWATSTGGRLTMESRVDATIRDDLAGRGHQVEVAAPWGVRACSQLISSLPGGGWAVASDLRGEGLALAI